MVGRWHDHASGGRSQAPHPTHPQSVLSGQADLFLRRAAARQADALAPPEMPSWRQSFVLGWV